MAATPASKSAAIRARLNHPVIDSDGHTVEFLPAVFAYLEQTGGTQAVEWFKASARGGDVFGPWYRLSPEERREWRATRPPWWALPTKDTLDRATALFPKLLCEQFDERRMSTIRSGARCGAPPGSGAHGQSRGQGRRQVALGRASGGTLPGRSCKNAVCFSYPRARSVSTHRARCCS